MGWRTKKIKRVSEQVSDKPSPNVPSFFPAANKKVIIVSTPIKNDNQIKGKYLCFESNAWWKAQNGEALAMWRHSVFRLPGAAAD
jgi:hypothetical protein